MGEPNPEHLKMTAYVGIAFWSAIIVIYLIGFFFNRLSKIPQSAAIINSHEKLISLGRKLTKFCLVLIIIRCLYSIYIFFTNNYTIPVENTLILVCLLIPAYLGGLAALRLIDIINKKQS